MPSIELSKLQAVSAPRAPADTDRLVGQEGTGTRTATARGGAAAGAGVAIDVSSQIDTSQPPLDTDRVAQIREALKEGSYPLVPAEIADAMIAAQISFGIAR